MTDKDEIYSLKQDDPDSNQQVFKISLALGIGVVLIYLAFLKPGIWGIDGNDMFWVSYSIVTEGDFSTGPQIGVLGRGGEYYSIRYPLLPILATPFVVVGIVVGNILGIPTRYTATLCALVLPLLLTAITTSLVALLALRLGSSKRGAYLAAIGYAFGTTALVYSREFFAEPLLALLTTASIYLALGKTYREQAGASILAGLAITAKPAGIVIGPLVSFYFLCKKYSWRTVITPLVGTAMGVFLYMGYNYLRFESFFGSGQSSNRIQLLGMPERLLGMLFSPGAGGGLIWYCPPTILAIYGFRKAFRTKPLEALLLLGIFLGYLVLHSFWIFRGWNWGPRFLVPALPALLALVAVLEKKWWDWIVALTLLGLFWNAPTLVSYYQRYYAEASDRGDFAKAIALWGDPLDAPLFNAWGAAFRQLGTALTSNVAEVIHNVGEPPGRGNLASSDLLRIVAVWWWVLPAVGIPIWVGFVIAIILVGLGIWLLVRGWREMGE
ncbi:hypothetical protein Ple7327_3635 [Pleurocapsa sp. PCC 7327]|uniref:hypothetical protein n=1 Tax=Pleurocapsa sp. PCC 7327 TaxID=118163 RepID=UPI00029F884C|nr:hypothetical protein [Pleurocapsa sp. PCC 7327]AFY78830.1 hypothetical protein Ple7327_3635 [Pleurocapsa sp. PCC 7327]